MKNSFWAIECKSETGTKTLAFKKDGHLFFSERKRKANYEMQALPELFFTKREAIEEMDKAEKKKISNAALAKLFKNHLECVSAKPVKVMLALV